MPTPWCHLHHLRMQCTCSFVQHAPPCPNRRSLGYLVNRNQPEQLQAVVAQLCDKLTDGSKEQLRDVASLGLKTVVAGAGAEEATAVEHESHTTGMACWLAGVGSLASSQMDVALPAAHCGACPALYVAPPAGPCLALEQS